MFILHNFSSKNPWDFFFVLLFLSAAPHVAATRLDLDHHYLVIAAKPGLCWRLRSACVWVKVVGF